MHRRVLLNAELNGVIFTPSIPTYSSWQQVEFTIIMSTCVMIHSYFLSHLISTHFTFLCIFCHITYRITHFFLSSSYLSKMEEVEKKCEQNIIPS
uniref:Uncharacterized protein n=1 Tax=Lotus japonicus TaxID=34305 RepID=I3SGF0_LOTJA|nr:unknown [Lotus japonicus]